MKYFFLFCITVTFFCSCTRSNSKPNLPDPPVTQDSVYVISTIVSDGSYPDKRTFTYGPDGRLSGESDSTLTSVFHTTYWTFSYKGSTIYISTTRGEKDTVELNSHGYITKEIDYEDSAVIKTYIYNYTDDTLLANLKFNQSSIGLTFEVNYQFENGDMVRSMDDNGGTSDVSYYQSMPVVEPDMNSDIILGTFPGTYIVRNRHLIKSVGTTNLSYTLDASGRVLTQTDGSNTTTFTYAHIPISKN